MCRSYSVCASARVVLAEKPKRPLASRCSEVRSYSAGDICVEGLDSSVTLPLWARQAATTLCAAASDHRRDSRFSGSRSSFLNAGSIQRPSYRPAAATKVACTSQ
ncbi:Uncharacterised protein [Bordetella pertussis]|nr:Uncharacterised protein [Bordetella pertussis]CFV97361.1 Uncharacterised protein [Bordetella pertussis]